MFYIEHFSEIGAGVVDEDWYDQVIDEDPDAYSRTLLAMVRYPKRLMDASKMVKLLERRDLWFTRVVGCNIRTAIIESVRHPIFVSVGGCTLDTIMTRVPYGLQDYPESVFNTAEILVCDGVIKKRSMLRHKYVPHAVVCDDEDPAYYDPLMWNQFLRIEEEFHARKDTRSPARRSSKDRNGPVTGSGDEPKLSWD